MRTRSLIATVTAALVGVAAGAGIFTFFYAKGGSYLTNDPAACANCHVMEEQFAGWTAGSHRGVAVCNDCHTPPGFVAKYAVKALNGWNHSRAFTTGEFHEPIQITGLNRRVTQAACRGCHGEIVAAIDARPSAHSGPLDCIECHRDVGHLH